MMHRLNLRVVASVLTVVIMAAACVPSQTTTAPSKEQPATPTVAPTLDNSPSKDATTFTLLSYGEINTVDPSRCYDTGCGSVLLNIYEGLVTYAGPNPTQIKPLLAKSIPEPVDTGNDGVSYTWEILNGVKFHNGDTLLAHDVAYSFWRTLLEGDFGTAPGFLLMEAFFLNPVTKAPLDDPTEFVDPMGGLIGEPDKLKQADPASLVAACEKVKAAITYDDARSTVTMQADHKWGPLMATLVGSWAYVQDQAWVVAQGGWNGDCQTWQSFYGRPVELGALRDKTNGTGPYQLDHWTPNEELVLTANPAYRGGPAKINRIVDKTVQDFGTRFLSLQVGDADVIGLSSAADWTQLDTLVRDDCDLATGQCVPFAPDADQTGRMLRRYAGMTVNFRSDLSMNYHITEGSPYIGSGVLDGDGIPSDFFSDVNIRKAFAYCFDVDTVIKDVYLGEGTPSLALTLPNQPGYDTATRYNYDLDKCKAAFAASTLRSQSGKTVNEVGFYLQLPYLTGNAGVQTIAQILADSLAKANPKFVLAPIGLGNQELVMAFREKTRPLFVVGWFEDIHDPHNWYVPYLNGIYATSANFPDDLKAAYAELINRGVFEIDQAKRAVIYQQLNQLVYDNAAYILGVRTLGRYYEPLYVHGWWGSKNQNPMVFGGGLYFYNLFKD